MPGLADRRHLVGASALAGGLAASPGPGWIAPLLALVALVGLVHVAGRDAGMLAAGLIVVGATVGAARVDSVDRCAGGACLGSRVSATAELLERPRRSRFGSQAALALRSGPGRGVKVLALADDELRWPHGADAGVRVAIVGRAHPLKRTGFGEHLRRGGVAAEVELAELRALHARRGGLLGAVDGMRRRAERELSRGLPSRERALVRGMVLGQDDAIDPPTREDFRRSGLAHVLAVSGQNVMLLGAIALPLLALAGLGPRARVAALLALIAVYVPLAGAGPALQRAGVMGTAGLAALAAGRPASRAYALALAAVATLAWNPRVAAEPGWQLSFAAVAGILVLAPPLRRRLADAVGTPAATAARPRAGRASAVVSRVLVDAMAVTVAATVATGPLVAHHFGSVSLAGLAANLVAVPLVAPIVWLGLMETALAQLPAAASAVAPATGSAVGDAVAASCTPIGAVNGVLLAALGRLAETFAELPGAEVDLPLGSPAAVVLAYGALAILALGFRRGARRVEPRAREGLAAWRRLSSRRRLAAACAAAAVAVLGCAEATAPPAPPSRLTVSFLDVGQGDATLIQDGPGAAILVDGGPPEARTVRLLRRAGVRRLDLVVATHASRDHHGGLEEIVRRMRVGTLLDGGDGTAEPTFRALLAEADRRGVRRVPARAGQVLRAGRLTIRVLSPPPRRPGPAPEDPNPRAVVAVVSVGSFDLFLSGDAESPALLGLRLPDVEAMKVPHHGSADPGLPELLERLRPEVAAIEVGADNSYGHPAPSTVAVLERAVPHVYRTDRDGTVMLSGDGRGMRARTER